MEINGDIVVEEIKALAELGSKIIDANFFDLTQDKRNMRDFLNKVILEEGEVSEENLKKAALILEMNKVQKQIKRSCRVYMEADKIICKVGKSISRPSDEWLEYFEDLCTKASNENIQKMWARILVKEHLDAGSITKAMMSSLAMLDGKSARAFAKICTLTFLLKCEDGECYYIPLILYDDILMNIMECNRGKKAFTKISENLKKYSKYLPSQKEIEYLSELGLLKLSPVHDESEIYSHKQMRLCFQVGKKVYETESICDEENGYYYIPTGQAFYTQAGLALYHALGKSHYKYLYDLLKGYLKCKKEME